MSILTRIKTGLYDYEWKEAWRKIQVALPVGVAYVPKFEEWKQACMAEGRNRQFIHYATTGKRISFRLGVQEVIAEIITETEALNKQATELPWCPSVESLRATKEKIEQSR